MPILVRLVKGVVAIADFVNEVFGTEEQEEIEWVYHFYPPDAPLEGDLES